MSARAAYRLEIILALAFAVSLAPLDSTAQRISGAHKIDSALDELLTKGSGPDAVRVIIRAKVNARESVKAKVRSHGGRLEAEHASINAFAATLRPADVQSLAGDPAVATVSIDAVVSPHQDVATMQLGAAALPRRRGTGAGVRIAVVDSGLEPTPDLDATRIIGFYDFTRGGVPSAPFDDYGHGTHVAGLIAGDGANSGGAYAGMAPAAQILALKVLDQNGQGYTSDVIRAIEFVVANRKALGIDIINLSLGHPIFESATTDPLVLAVQEAAQAGLLVVVAAGNNGRNPVTGLVGYGGITSPGNAPSAITVGALDAHNTAGPGDDTIPSYSSRGPTWYDAYAKPDIVAPGHRLIPLAALNSTLYAEHPELHITGKDGDVPRYLRLSGTSMATAVVSGTAALMLEASRTGKTSVSHGTLKAMLEWSAIPLAGYDALTQGAGGLNVAGALALVHAVDPTHRLRTTVTPWTTIGSFSWPWAQSVVCGNTIVRANADTVIWGNADTVIWGSADTVSCGNANTIIWGNANTVIWGNANTVIWGNADTVIWGSAHTVIWGNADTVVWGNASVWSATIVWGSQLIGTLDGTTVIWGNTQVTPSTVVWGNLASMTGLSGDTTFGNLNDQP